MTQNEIQPTPLDAYEMGTGTWAWGDKLVWGYGQGYRDEDVRAAFDASLAHDITLFDTAEMYGFGQSERLLGQFRDTKRRIFIATKFLPFPWRVTKTQFRAALRGSLKRLGVGQIDLYQIHFPVPVAPEERWADALADALDLGLIRMAGVSNYNREQTIRSHYTLARRGYQLASNQVEYSLIERKIERDGTLDACRERGIKVIAYSPLGMGLLTGKYSAENPPPGVRGRQYRDLLPKLPPLIDALKRIGAAHEGKTPAQVALNWTICKGTLPIPGAKTAGQVASNAGALGWRLTADEVAELDAVSGRIVAG